MKFELLNIYTLSVITFLYILFNLKNFKILNKNNLLEKSSSRIYFFDFLKGLAIVCVFVAHVASFYKNELGEIYFLLVKIFRFAIPFFMMSSGFLLSLKNFNKSSIINFYKSKFHRILIPYILTCIFLFIVGKYDFNFSNLIKIFDGSILTPFYFIPILIQLYLIYPLILLIIRRLGNKKSIILFYIISIIGMMFFNNIYRVHVFVPYTFFFVFGIIIKEYLYDKNLKNILKVAGFKKFSIIIFIIYFLFSFLETKEEYSNFQLIYSPVLLILLYYFNNNLYNKKIYRAFSFFGKNSLYIFLFHFIFLEYIYKIINIYIVENSYLKYFLYIFFSIIFGFFIPLLFSFLINKKIEIGKIKE